MQNSMGNQYGNFGGGNQMIQGNMQNNPQLIQAGKSLVHYGFNFTH